MVGSGANSAAILIPIFNDWESVRLLLPLISTALAGTSWTAEVCLVDDGSTVLLPDDWTAGPVESITSIEVLHLRRNLGHQRAIAVGLFHIHERYTADAVLVMDGDGEDRAQDIPTLLAEFDKAGRTNVVFAERTKRMEGTLFKTFYSLYRWSHHALTGISVRVGNFSVIPPLALSRLMVVSELWNHYAAAIFRARIPYQMAPLPRGERLTGESRMSFVSLVVHGLSAMSVFSDQVSARVLIGALGTTVALGIGMIFADSAWPMFLLMVQVLMLSVLFVFTIISGRNHLGFLPIRDARFFIMSRTSIVQRSNSMEALASAIGTIDGIASIETNREGKVIHGH